MGISKNQMKLIKALLLAINATKFSNALDLELESEAFLEQGRRHRLCINPDTITMSGYSAGAFMTHKMHVVLSDTIKGVYINQGGPTIGPVYPPNDYEEID